MTPALEELIHLLDERKIAYSVTDDKWISTDIQGEVADYRVYGQADADSDLFQILGYVPLRAPEGCRAALAEAVARANNGLILGKFELGLEDGRLRFQMAQILTGDSAGEEVIDRMIGTTLSMLEMYLPAFLSVI